MLWRPCLCALLALSACAPLYAPETILHAAHSGDTAGVVPGTDTTSSVTAGTGGGTASDGTSTGGTAGASTTGGTSTSTTTSTGAGTTTTSTTTTTTTGSTPPSCKDYGTFANHPVQGGATAQLDLAVDNANAFVTWSEATAGANSVFVLRGDRGGTFSAVGGANTAPGVSNVTSSNLFPAIAVDVSHLPLVAWAGQSTTDGAFALRLDATNTWGALGTSNTSGIGPALQTHSALMLVATAIAPSGVPYVAWLNSSDQSLYVRRYKEGSWQVMGNGILSATNITGAGQLALIAPSDTAVAVAWLSPNLSGYSAVKLLQWDGASWNLLGTTSDGVSNNSSSDVSSFSLAAQVSGPGLAWSDSRLAVKNVYFIQWNGQAWSGLGTNPSSTASSGVSGQFTRDASRPSLAVDPNGFPVIAWQQQPNTGNADQIFMRRWDGKNWVSDGTSSTAGGVSGNNNANVWPKVDVTPGNVPVIAWQELGSNGNGVVHVCGWH